MTQQQPDLFALSTAPVPSVPEALPVEHLTSPAGPVTHADRLAGVPPFTICGVTFTCWVTDGGHRYEWRSADGLLKAGRNSDASTCWGLVAGRSVGDGFGNLKQAMIAAVARQVRDAA